MPPPTADLPITAQPAAPSTRTLFFSVFPCIMLPMFLAALDQTIVATALPAIAGDLGDVERVSWVVVSYLVATTIAAPIYGRIGDVMGRRRMMFVALAVFMAASVLCAMARGIIPLSLARIAQGLGGGGLMTLSQALVGESVPPRERARFQGYLATVYMSASTFGPVAGGWLTQHFGWQSVFLINLPLGVLALALAYRLPIRAIAGGKLHFDFWGTLLFAAFVIPTLLALERVQRFDLAAVPVVLALSAVAIAALVLLLRQERRAPAPLLPLKLLSQPAIWRSDAMAMCVGATLISMISFLPMYLQVVRGTTPSQTGFLILPLTAGVAFGSLLTGRVIAFTGRTALLPSIGLVVSACSLVFLGLFAHHLTTTQLPWVFALTSLSLGTAMPVVQTTVQMVAGPKMLGSAAASVQFSRSVGAALGTATVGAVLFAALAAIDPHTATMFADLVERGPTVLASQTADQAALIQAEIARAFRIAFTAVAVFAGCGAVLAWSIPVRRI